MYAARRCALRLAQTRAPIQAPHHAASASLGLSRERSLPICPSLRHVHATPRALGVMDGLRGAYDKAVSGSSQAREAKVFQAQLKYLADGTRPMDGDVFLKLVHDLKLASGLGGAKEHLPWVQNNPALTEFREQERIARALTPAERRNLETVGFGGKKRAAREAGVEVRSVEAVVGQIKTMRAIQKWLTKWVAEGGELPTDAAGLQTLLTRPGAGMSRKAPRGRRTNPGVKGGVTGKG